MSCLLESTFRNQMWQRREFTDEKEDQVQPKEEPRHLATQQRILQNYDDVDQSPVCVKECFNDQAESCRKRSYSAELASKKWTVKCERIGETHDKLVTDKPSSKLRRDQMIGKKECHNKVCTLKGPRDRRVRLSAHTAIKFYDVQDRLGYEQPSKAIDWLIEKAKDAIEALAHELPCQNHDSADSNIDYVPQMKQVQRGQSLYHPQCSSYGMEIQQCVNETNMDNEVIFSMASQFQDCPAQQNSTQGHFMCLHSYENPYGLNLQHSSPIGFAEQVLNSASNLLPDSNSTNPNCLQSLTAFDSLPSALQQPLLIDRENQFLSQRGTLQSSNLLSLLASTNPPICIHGHAHYSQSPNFNLDSTKEFSSGGFVGI